MARQQDDMSPLAQFLPGITEVVDSIKDAFGTSQEASPSTGPRTPRNAMTTTCEGCGAPLIGKQHSVVKCDYCDRETRLQ
ncbi:hypothetical protein [Bifidobacterium pullorum]|uniref:hypothetical protein n=1 Tax=Bifidobacterium pullorum TaxID=78448 RepID=UPI0005299256|nr:hypothetical protein [Bifidobacterium pullorum]